MTIFHMDTRVIPNLLIWASHEKANITHAYNESHSQHQGVIWQSVWWKQLRLSLDRGRTAGKTSEVENWMLILQMPKSWMCKLGKQIRHPFLSQKPLLGKCILSKTVIVLPLGELCLMHTPQREAFFKFWTNRQFSGSHYGTTSLISVGNNGEKWKISRRSRKCERQLNNDWK